ncbi:MAG: hypothetical protein JNK53_08550 [Phycisphaerae bacterium]|nr:hypothetical protein [Phycisphaerae bacterium]
MPGTLTECSAIAAGAYHTLAVQLNGTAKAWGLNSDGQVLVPSNLGACLGVAGGGFHSLALKLDGTIQCWGANNYGQSAPPNQFAPFQAIEAGRYHSVALTQSGTVKCWGAGFVSNPWPAIEQGQCLPPAGLGACVRISAGDFNTVVIEARPEACPGDFTRNGTVSGEDLGILLTEWGGDGVADLSGNGVVDGADLGLFLGMWGPCP